METVFTNNQNLSFLLGFIITFIDNGGAASIIHYNNSKSKKITRSALAAELYAIINGFNRTAALKVLLNQLEPNARINNSLKSAVPMVIYTDSRSLYNNLVSLNITTEKKLLIDLYLLRQAYKRREITKIRWIATEQNPANALTKEKSTPALV